MLQKVNEVRWALVDEDGEIATMTKYERVARNMKIEFPEYRLTRVRITEIEEGVEDGQG